MPAKKLATKPQNSKKPKRIVLLDVHAIIHRAYHALPDFASSKGVPTGALYGLCSMLIKIVNDLKPDYIAACYDLPEPTYRHEAYANYKAGRAKTDEALVSQIIKSRDVFTAFNIPMYEKAGFEADDMLGTIAEKVKAIPNVDTIIASGDMDTLQLVDGHRVRVYTLKKGINDTIMYDEDAVRSRFNFGPELIPDYKGLRGDPSDNIIGVKGVGEKTATILITNFGTIEQMYTKLKKDKKAFIEAGLTERIVQLLVDNEEEARFSKMLATIRRDAPIDFSLPEQTWKEGLKTAPILALFSELEFRTLGNRIKEAFSLQPSLMGSADTSGVTKSKKHAPDEGTHSTGVEVTYDEAPAPDYAELAKAIDPHELKETSIALWVIDSNIQNPGLEEILGFAKTDDFAEARKIILEQIDQRKLGRVYRDIELPLIPIVEAMETRGIKVDKKHMSTLSKRYHTELEKIQKKVYEMAGEEFNINSPKQLGEILFTKMGLTAKNLKKTEGGARSTRESELIKMADIHPIIKLILDYRELQKLLSTYIDNIPTMLDAKSRLHATFLQAGTTTGRMSSNNPNLQNIPIKSELGRAIRDAFVAEEGFTFVSFDYSQFELRIAAFLSGDKKLMEIFQKGEDVHTAVASRVFSVPPQEVTKEMRRRAKVINFGIIYGMGVNALKANLGTSRAEAQEFYDNYFITFKTLAEYLDKVRAQTARDGYTETLFGRRRYFEGIKSRIPFIRASAERMAINAPIQGTEADLVKLAMVRIDEYIKKNGLEKDVYALLQVHDELVYEVRNAKVAEVAAKLTKIADSVISLKESAGVPIEVHAYQGRSWGEMEEESAKK